jgi:hypothetical protein
MSDRSPKSLHHRTHGYRAALALVAGLAAQWEQGRPIRLVRKVLRKRGIHPWSLLLHVEGQALSRLIKELRVPAWGVEASHRLDPSTGEMGFAFQVVPRGRRLPEGLVSPYFAVTDSPDLRVFPRRLWSPWLSFQNVPRPKVLPSKVTGLACLTLIRCSGLKGTPRGMVLPELLEVRACAGIRSLRFLRRRDRAHVWVNLAHLPGLQRFAPGSRLDELRIWKCPALERLDGVTVTGGVIIHACAALRTLPRAETLNHLEVTDCPSLGWSRLPKVDPIARFDPWDGPSQWDSPERIPRSQSVVEPSLFPEGGWEPVWPWPPPAVGSPAVDKGMNRVLVALGIPPLAQVRMHAHRCGNLQTVLEDLLADQPDPGSAVRLAMAWLREAAEARDAAMAKAILLEAEAMGIGALSVAMELPNEAMGALGLGLPDTWIRSFRSSDDQPRASDLKELVPGPMVLLHVWPPWVEQADLREVEGPLWVGEPLTIRDCPCLETLPASMAVHGDLTIEDCPALQRFPRHLEVHGNLMVRDLPRLGRTVCRARVSGRIEVSGAPRLSLMTLEHSARTSC